MTNAPRLDHDALGEGLQLGSSRSEATREPIVIEVPRTHKNSCALLIQRPTSLILAAVAQRIR